MDNSNFADKIHDYIDRMLARSLRNITVLIFLFAVLEKTGLELISFMKYDCGFDNLTEIFESTEKTTKESENKENTLKEFWLIADLQTSLKPTTLIGSANSLFLNPHIAHSFYPSVPTPPPNLMALNA